MIGQGSVEIFHSQSDRGFLGVGIFLLHNKLKNASSAANYFLSIKNELDILPELCYDLFDRFVFRLWHLEPDVNDE